MRILDLVYSRESHIKYEVTNYPDGQQDIWIEDSLDDHDITIQSRLNNFEDLELILCATSVLRNQGHSVSLQVPYLLGSRSDRRFPNKSHYLKDVICPILNLQNYDRVDVLDPHSDVIEALLSNIHLMSIEDCWERAMSYEDLDHRPERLYVVSPDAGALKRCLKAAKVLGANGILECSKNRDITTGKILHTTVHVPNNYSPLEENGTLLVVDDICDGGRTFVELAKTIRGNLISFNGYRLILWVTHGIFSSGLGTLLEYYDRIYCTNSVKDVSHDRVTQVKVI